LAHIAESIRAALAEDKTAALKVLSDAEREAVCAVLTDAESDPALRRAFNLLCADRNPWKRPRLQVVILLPGRSRWKMEVETNTLVVDGATLASGAGLPPARHRIARCGPRRGQAREVREREVRGA
jgi:hypothetical protein